MPKKLFKKCPSCKYDKCWSQAKICEQCGYDFLLQRKPRVAKIELPEDDDDVPPPAPKAEPPPQTTKKCPGCGFPAWYKAPLCERCEYDFINNRPKEKPKPEIRREWVVQGYRPLFGRPFHLIEVVAFGGYGKVNEDRAKSVLKIKPPKPDNINRNSVSNWIQKLQDYGYRGERHRNEEEAGPSKEYTLPAVLSILGEHTQHPDYKESSREVVNLVKSIFADLEVGIPMQFTDEEDEEPVEEVPAKQEDEEPVEEVPVKKRRKARK